jgi:hypothetical protein
VGAVMGLPSNHRMPVRSASAVSLADSRFGI